MKRRARYALGVDMIEDEDGRIDFVLFQRNRGVPMPPVITILENLLAHLKDDYKHKFDSSMRVSG